MFKLIKYIVVGFAIICGVLAATALGIFGLHWLLASVPEQIKVLVAFGALIGFLCYQVGSLFFERNDGEDNND